VPGAPPVVEPGLPGPGIAPPVTPTSTTPGPALPQTRVRLAFRLNRQQLYQSFQALGNLTEKAGTVDVTVEAGTPEGFDSVWLRNAVLEPLEEADIEVEREE
jgi:hypothetical protein